jgi:hypothetical protein
MSHPQPRDPYTTTPAGPVRILTDGQGTYFVPVYLARPDGTAVYVGMDVYREVTDQAVNPLDIPAPRRGRG